MYFDIFSCRHSHYIYCNIVIVNKNSRALIIESWLGEILIKKILLFEDCQTWAQLISSVLSQDRGDVWSVPMVVNSPFCDFSAILSEVGKVDAAIVDLFFNGEVAGIEMVRCIKKEIKCPVLVLTSHAEPEWMIEARQAGADSFLDKRNLDELPKVLLSTLGPCPFWSVSSVQILLDEHARVLAEARAKILTHMEKQILSLIHQGHTQSQVAVKLYIEERTVKNHINRILKKLKAKSSRDAASIAYSKGMLIS